MYEENDWNDRWQGHSEKIITLTRHITTLIDNNPENFGEGVESVKDILERQKLTAKLYNYVFDVLEKDYDLFHDLADQYKYQELAYEYLVIDAMNDDVEAALNDVLGESGAIPHSEWNIFLKKIEPSVHDTKKLVAMRLGADLHTSPADASLDLMQNLTRRVQSLQDW
jgi:hypothetical protein